MITRDEALAIGNIEIRLHGLGIRACEALLIDEIHLQHPRILGGPNLADCWIVYAEPGTSTLALRDSSIVLVSRATGAVVYRGPAGDEG